MATRLRALAAYRSALRATQIAFKGDTVLLNASRAQIRQGFHQPDESKTVEERIEHLEGVAQFLTANIVQGQRQDNGRFHLNLHEGSELGDNDSIAEPKSTLVAGRGTRGGCCGGGGQQILKEKRA